LLAVKSTTPAAADAKMKIGSQIERPAAATLQCLTRNGSLALTISLSQSAFCEIRDL
jgi:hypothetical protein